jgi:ribosomal-protein-alanine N-acetyltransferase
MVSLATIEDIPTIENCKMKLRKMHEQDACAVFQYYNNENVYRYLDWNGPTSVGDARRVIEIWNKGFEEGWILRFGIADKVTNQIIGTIFLNNFEGRRAEIGYEMSEDYWNKGIMSEAIKEVIQLGFNQLGLARVQAFVCEENTASRHLLRKFGFQEEGLLRQYECHSVSGKCKDMFIYSLLNGECSVM